MSPHRPLTRGPGRRGDPSLPHRLAREIEGEVLFDPARRGRYAPAEVLAEALAE